jgi:hypothetical protein
MKEVSVQQNVSNSVDAIYLLYSQGFITKKEFNNIYIKIKDYANESRHSTEPGKNS